MFLGGSVHHRSSYSIVLGFGIAVGEASPLLFAICRRLRYLLGPFDHFISF